MRRRNLIRLVVAVGLAAVVLAACRSVNTESAGIPQAHESTEAVASPEGNAAAEVDVAEVLSTTALAGGPSSDIAVDDLLDLAAMTPVGEAALANTYFPAAGGGPAWDAPCFSSHADEGWAPSATERHIEVRLCENGQPLSAERLTVVDAQNRSIAEVRDVRGATRVRLPANVLAGEYLAVAEHPDGSVSELPFILSHVAPSLWFEMEESGPMLTIAGVGQRDLDIQLLEPVPAGDRFEFMQAASQRRTVNGYARIPVANMATSTCIGVDLYPNGELTEGAELVCLAGGDVPLVECLVSQSSAIIGEEFLWTARVLPATEYVETSLAENDFTVASSAHVSSYFTQAGTHEAAVLWSIGDEQGRAQCPPVTVTDCSLGGAQFAETCDGKVTVACAAEPRVVEVGKAFQLFVSVTPPEAQLSGLVIHGDDTPPLTAPEGLIGQFGRSGSFEPMIEWNGLDTWSDSQGGTSCGPVEAVGLPPGFVACDDAVRPDPAAAFNLNIFLKQSSMPGMSEADSSTTSIWHSPTRFVDCAEQAGPVGHVYWLTSGGGWVRADQIPGRPGLVREQDITVSCAASATAVQVGESLTLTLDVSPANAAVLFDVEPGHRSGFREEMSSLDYSHTIHGYEYQGNFTPSVRWEHGQDAGVADCGRIVVSGFGPGFEQCRPEEMATDGLYEVTDRFAEDSGPPIDTPDPAYAWSPYMVGPVVDCARTTAGEVLWFVQGSDWSHSETLRPFEG